MTTQNLGQEFKISEAVIFAERLEDEYNVTNYIGELSFFEDIERPYVTAQMVVMDDIGVFDEIKLRGSEQIRFTVESVESSVGNLSFTIIMNIVSIIQKDKVGDRSELFHINCISPHAYRDAAIKISRSYTGKPDQIAEAILKNHLDVDVDTTLAGNFTGIVEPMKVITPYISPLEAVEWLISRAAGGAGTPFYCWQSLYDQVDGKDRVRFGVLTSMMPIPSFNFGVPLTYSAAAAQSVADAPLDKQAFMVKRINVQNVQDTLKMVHEGSIGSNLQVVDTYTSNEFNRHYSISEQLERMEKLLIVPYGANQNVFDDQQTLTYSNDTKPIDEWDARYVTNITSYGTYGAVNSYHDEQDPGTALNKIRINAVKSMFNKNMIEVVIPGITFMSALGKGNSGVSVGDTIMIDFLNSNVDEDEQEVYNEELSGKYLIMKVRNVFADTKHEVVACISKIGTRPPQGI